MDNLFTQEFANQIQELFQAAITQGHCTPSKFRKELDKFVRDSLPSKGKTAEDISEIKAHFCRGRKWVSIPTDHDLHSAVVEKAQSEDLLELNALWTEHEQAWVRFHSASNGIVYFSLHENSSVGSSIKVPVPSDTALTLTLLDGTPKSLGLEASKTTEVEEDENAEEIAEFEAELDSVDSDEEEIALIEAELNEANADDDVIEDDDDDYEEEAIDFTADFEI